MTISRRELMQRAARGVAVAGLAAASGGWPVSADAEPIKSAAKEAASTNPTDIALGLCTYQWGKDWELPKLIGYLEKAGVRGVELRTEHAHHVEPTLSEAERADVRRRFEESKVTLVGLGTNQSFDSPDATKLRAQIEGAKKFIVLSHDVGGSGVKVKPNDFQKDVPHEKTVEQIGRSLKELGEFAEGYGQQIRLEVHGSCCELPTIKAIMDVADHPNVGVCWNSNPQDLQGAGLAGNFALVQKRLGATCHVRELENDKYPFAELIGLLVKAKYNGWVLIESTAFPTDPVAGLSKQRELLDQMIARALAAAGK